MHQLISCLNLLVVDKFNEKYSNLGISQKKMLKEYINNVTNSVKLKKYILSETTKIKDIILTLKSSISSKIIKIKLNEVSNLLSEMF